MTSNIQARNQKREKLLRRANLPLPDKSKAELREELARAVRNTAALQVAQNSSPQATKG